MPKKTLLMLMIIGLFEKSTCQSLQCEKGDRQSPIIIDDLLANEYRRNDVVFHFSRFQDSEFKSSFKLNFQRYELSITGLNTVYYVPQLKFNKTMWNLYKVWFRYKYNLAGPEHEFANIEYLEDLIGELSFEFLSCEQREGKSEFILVVIPMTLANSSNLYSKEYSGKPVNFDYIFAPPAIVMDAPKEKMKRTKYVISKLRWSDFMPPEDAGAYFYEGSFAVAQCMEIVSVLVFDMPIVVEIGPYLKEFYANDSNNARPVQDKRIVTKYSKENIKFYDHTPEDSEKCARFKTEYGAGDMADITMNDTFSEQRKKVGEKFDASEHADEDPTLPLVFNGVIKNYYFSSLLFILLLYYCIVK